MEHGPHQKAQQQSSQPPQFSSAMLYLFRKYSRARQVVRQAIMPITVVTMDSNEASTELPLTHDPVPPSTRDTTIMMNQNWYVFGLICGPLYVANQLSLFRVKTWPSKHIRHHNPKHKTVSKAPNVQQSHKPSRQRPVGIEWPLLPPPPGAVSSTIIALNRSPDLTPPSGYRGARRERERKENEQTRNGMANVSRKNHRDEEPALFCAQLERVNIMVHLHKQSSFSHKKLTTRTLYEAPLPASARNSYPPGMSVGATMVMVVVVAFMAISASSYW
jgi:hypothetical protein